MIAPRRLLGATGSSDKSGASLLVRKGSALLALRVFLVGSGDLGHAERLLSTSVSLHLGEEPRALGLFFGSGAEHLNLLFGRERVAAHARFLSSRFLFDGRFRGRSRVGREKQVLVGEICSSSGRFGIGVQETGTVGPRGKGTGAAHAKDTGEGDLARFDVEKGVVVQGWRRGSRNI